MFRQESKHLGADGKPVQQLANTGPKKYQKSFKLLKEWVENNLELYKVRSPYAATPETPGLSTDASLV